MLNWYYLVIALQAFCIYHAYKSRAPYWWFFLILFLPLLGCGLYLVIHFYNRRNIETLGEGLKGAVISNYSTSKLEAALELADTITNRINLADAYVADKKNAEAIELYESCLRGLHAEDPEILMKVVQAYSALEDYEAVVGYAEQLQSAPNFEDSQTQIALAVALHKLGRNEEAEILFKKMDKKMSNYQHRAAYTRYLIEIGKQDEAREKIAQLDREFELMQGFAKKLNREYIREIKSMQKNLG